MTKYRLILLGFLFVLGFSLVIFRAVHLQLLPHNRVELLAKRQLSQKLEILGRRGTITDRNGIELAVSTNSYSIFANPKLIKKPREVIDSIVNITHGDRSIVQKKITDASTKKFIWIARQLSSDQVLRLTDVDLKKIEGIGILPEYRREFPLGSLAAHILGFVDIDGNGIEGVEKEFDTHLTGMKNSVQIGRDALGRPVFSHNDQIKLELAKASKIELTIDSKIQYSAEKALRDAVEAHHAKGGTVIVLDPYTGEVLALANYPTFDPGQYRSTPQDRRRNRAITDPIEPASVIKPFVVARALQDKLVTQDTMISAGNGYIKVGKKIIGEANAKHRFKSLSISDVIRHSSNVGIVVLKNKMGFPRIEDTYRKLGFGSYTGIELSGESRGIFVSPKPTQLLEQATMSFGQGISLTPLQIATGYAAIANGGFRVKPHILKRIFVNEELKFEMPAAERPPESDRVFSELTSKKMRAILERVVEEEGTGSLARVEGLKVAGKTGTAQKIDWKFGGYERGAYWSSFSGFIPSDKPRFVIYAMIDNPTKGGYYGGEVAAPVFSKTAQAAVRLLNGSATPIFSRKSSGAPRSLTKLSAHPTKSDFVKPKVLVDQGAMPDLTGLSLAGALKLLDSRGLGIKNLEVENKGDWVEEQMPAAGTRIEASDSIRIQLR